MHKSFESIQRAMRRAYKDTGTHEEHPSQHRTTTHPPLGVSSHLPFAIPKLRHSKLCELKILILMVYYILAGALHNKKNYGGAYGEHANGIFMATCARGSGSLEKKPQNG